MRIEVLCREILASLSQSLDDARSHKYLLADEVVDFFLFQTNFALTSLSFSSCDFVFASDQTVGNNPVKCVAYMCLNTVHPHILFPWTLPFSIKLKIVQDSINAEVCIYERVDE